ncbi:PIN domain-containing protein [Arthrobacter sp. H14]|uniref:PIN domain-containing protein n=1 Tax=Arthrobacter sp. H14 TaxID=1312959 RepID=UPI0004BB84A7|nr:PIN domain-containing protein [Arthrobacter sp. H14]
MTTSGSLDANVLLRLLLSDVPHQHAAAMDLLTSGARFAVSDTALIEVNFVLGRAYGLTRDQQHEAIIGLLQQLQIVGNIDVFAAAFSRYCAHPKLSFEDCYLVSRAEANGDEPLWTFDKKLASQTAAQLLESGNA